jgi:hypothetical protein
VFSVRTDTRFSALLAAALIAAAVLAIYYPSLSAYFFEDDFEWLVSRWNFHPADLLTLRERYKPVFELYFWFGSVLTDSSSVAFHAASIAVHILNGWLVLALALKLGMRPVFAFVTAMLFVVQPSYVAAVAWVGALAESLVVLFGCASALALLRYRRAGNPVWLGASVASFTIALFTHESAVVFLPIIFFVDRIAHPGPWDWRPLTRVYWPFAVVTTGFLLLTFAINPAEYRTSEISYTLGPHVIRNVFEYIASIYVGERTLVWHLVVAAVLALVLAKGTPRSRLGIAWLILGILPFAPFDTANISRYAYVPAIGFAILLGEGLSALYDVLRPRGLTIARIVVAVIAVFLGLRFTHFAREGVQDLWDAAERYRQFLAGVARDHPQMTDHTVIYISPEFDKKMARRFVQAAVQFHFRNQTLRVHIR